MPETPKKSETETDLVSYTTTFKHLLPVMSKKEAVETIRQIEEALAGGSGWCNERHYFLSHCEKHALDAAHNRLEAGKFKISQGKMRGIARLGLVCAYQEGIVTAKQIGEFIDDIASLWLFANVLGEAEFEGDMSPIWDHAFDLPADVSEEILRDTEDMLYRIYRLAAEEGEKKS